MKGRILEITPPPPSSLHACNKTTTNLTPYQEILTDFSRGGMERGGSKHYALPPPPHHAINFTNFGGIWKNSINFPLLPSLQEINFRKFGGIW
jgi:hypothetical protein